ncbi:GNAT family N-acetyltransferase [Halobaculum limi]|uniref:GNAT family N-acetyltransferase n=1 Tax=Halobaculum limi TaxID=3031916 RepID=UPI00240660C8|nr:GNAT family N-acetyltransferase [Halobaculum sp. YSMS11]
MSDLCIRDATTAEAPTLAALYRAAYGDLVEAGFPTSAAETAAADVREWLADRECWVGVDGAGDGGAGASDDADRDSDESVVAAIQLRERPEWPCPEVCRLAVDPTRRREGIGATLLEYAEDVVADRGHDRVRLRSFTDHPFLLDWYEQRGYRQVDLQVIDSRPFDVPVLERRL